MQPVTLIQETPNSFFIVDGWKRIAALKILERKEIPAQTIRADDSFSKESKAHWLELNRHTRVINPMEKAFFLSSFLQANGGDSRKVAQDWAEKLEIPKTADAVEDFAGFAELPAEIQNALANSELAPHTAILLARLQKQDQQKLFSEVLQKCRFSVSESRVIVERILDLSVIEDARVSELVSNRKFQEILSSNSLAPKEKGRKLWTLVQALRFPEREKRLRDIRQECENVAAASNGEMTIRPPKNFESGALQLTITLVQNQSLTEVKRAFDERKTQASIEKIRRLLGGDN